MPPQQALPVKPDAGPGADACCHREVAGKRPRQPYRTTQDGSPRVQAMTQAGGADPSAVRLSQSRLWLETQSYYAEQGHQAWASGAIPFYLTNTPYLAAAYAELIAAWWHPAAGPGPYRILELGAGSGRFAYLLLQELAARFTSPTAWCYIASDGSQRTLDFLRAHPQLAPQFAAGQLELARTSPDRTGPIELQISGQMLAPGPAPVVVIANYVFDSLPQDCFVVRDGRLYECLLVEAPLTTANRQAPTPLPPRFELHQVAWNYYQDADLDLVLGRYRNGPDNRAILLPCMALRWLRQLRTQLGERLLLLVADKGYGEGQVGEVGAPTIEQHTPACASMMVNFDAIGTYVAAAGGTTLAWLPPAAPLGTVAYALDAGPHGDDRRREGLRQAFANAFIRRAPMDLFALVEQASRNPLALSLPALIGLLRLTRYDPTLFSNCFTTLLQGARQAPAVMRRDLLDCVREVWQRFYPIGANEPLAVQCGALLLEFGAPAEAAAILADAAAGPPPNPPAMFLLGRCLAAVGDKRAAHKHIAGALAIEPACEDYLCAVGILPHRMAQEEAAQLGWEIALDGLDRA
ncbi:MAG: hypothetical protein EA400_08605 [Chromatiaceae bacterium]|nr:MAG: hypothetical protein EA400_08605 [Chromatiaceae bacterium]